MIEIGPNLLEAAPWLFMLACVATMGTVGISCALCDRAHRIADAIVAIIEAWRGK